MSFGKNLAKIRKLKGVSQYKLAQDSGISRQSISLYERDEREPSLTAAWALAKVLGVRLEEFLEPVSHRAK